MNLAHHHAAEAEALIARDPSLADARDFLRRLARGHRTGNPALCSIVDGIEILLNDRINGRRLS